MLAWPGRDLGWVIDVCNESGVRSVTADLIDARARWVIVGEGERKLWKVKIMDYLDASMHRR